MIYSNDNFPSELQQLEYTLFIAYSLNDFPFYCTYTVDKYPNNFYVLTLFLSAANLLKKGSSLLSGVVWPYNLWAVVINAIGIFFLYLSLMY